MTHWIWLRRGLAEFASPGSGGQRRPASDQSATVSVSPELLAEIHSVILPLGIVLAALFARLIYPDLFIHSSGPVSMQFGAAILASSSPFASSFASQTELNSANRILAGKIGGHQIVTTISSSFLVRLCRATAEISDQYSRGWFALWYALSIVFQLLGHYGILIWARVLRAEKRLQQRVAIYGSVAIAGQVQARLMAQDPGLTLAGVFSDDTPMTPASDVQAVGGMQSLVAACQRGDCDRVILALPWNANSKIRDAIASLELLPIEVLLSPSATTIPSHPSEFGEVGDLLLVDIQRRPLSARGVLVKGAMDYLLGAIALVLFAPLMLIIALAIKLDSRGPVFFVQSRNGYNQRVVRVVKFRTMKVAEDGPVVNQATPNDSRVARLGRFLRRRSLDELPQLFNVLRGDLSLVGPRPHAVSHNTTLRPNYQPLCQPP